MKTIKAANFTRDSNIVVPFEEGDVFGMTPCLFVHFWSGYQIKPYNTIVGEWSTTLALDAYTVERRLSERPLNRIGRTRLLLLV